MSEGAGGQEPGWGDTDDRHCCRWDESHGSDQKMKSQDSNFGDQTPDYSMKRALRKGLKEQKEG